MELNPIGEPVNLLVALSDEILPDPGAILVTGITPQKTREEGFTEADFVRQLHDKVLTPGTTIVGFNSVRFDDEFMRYTLYRNFYDPYEWQWKDDRSRWDLLDVVRMTRALRPDSINWPTDSNGQPTNKLELLAKANNLEHVSAHDALSDVQALIGLAKLIKTRQPKLFDYLYNQRSKKAVESLVNLDDPQPFIYTSGRYPKEILHTTVAIPVGPGSRPGSVIVYDLRHDPAKWIDKTAEELLAIRKAPYEARLAPDFLPLPAKELAFNKCPVVAPLGVLDDATQARIGLDLNAISASLVRLRNSGLAQKLQEVFAKPGDYAKSTDVDARLYESFLSDNDKTKMRLVRAGDHSNLDSIKPEFGDERLEELLLRYKARNYPKSLSADEQVVWEAYRANRLQSDWPRFMQELAKHSEASDQQKQFVLEELKLWAESIMPADA